MRRERRMSEKDEGEGQRENEGKRMEGNRGREEKSAEKQSRGREQNRGRVEPVSLNQPASHPTKVTNEQMILPTRWSSCTLIQSDPIRFNAIRSHPMPPDTIQSGSIQCHSMPSDIIQSNPIQLKHAQKRQRQAPSSVRVGRFTSTKDKYSGYLLMQPTDNQDGEEEGEEEEDDDSEEKTETKETKETKEKKEGKEGKKREKKNKRKRVNEPTRETQRIAGLGPLFRVFMDPLCLPDGGFAIEQRHALSFSDLSAKRALSFSSGCL